MTVKTHDPASYDLAEHFLQDEPCSSDSVLYKKHCHSLALEIQQTVEDWFFSPDEESAPHMHVAGTTVGKHIDECAVCGQDIRCEIHTREM